MKNNRYKESIAPMIHFEKNDQYNYPIKILTSANDQGVIRNNGKNGSRFAPMAIINFLKKQNNHLGLNNDEAIYVEEILNYNDVHKFEELQKISTLKIQNNLIDQQSDIIHIGGGHDHIYPLLMAINECKHFENILVLNIDAHCDTRIDSEHHSGTPFRDFDNNGSIPFHLIQYGIHEYSNSTSTLTPLKRGSTEKLFYEDVRSFTKNQTIVPKDLFNTCPFEIDDKTALVLSLDCDGLSGNQMQAVSSVNTLGIDLQHVIDLIKEFKGMSKKNLFFGIYEFNPVFDNLSLYGCKSVVHLIYEFLKK